MEKTYMNVRLDKNGFPVVEIVPISPSIAREKLDCIARKDKAINDAYDHLRDGQMIYAMSVLHQEIIRK